MKEDKSIKEIAVRTIHEEGEAIAALVDSINDDFVKCVELILHSKGRVIITGIGKSAIIGAKLVASLNSTGTPSIFMHAADAIHGDLGAIQKEDIIICLSKSGETPEIKILIPLLKLYGSSLIAIVGNLQSYLAKQADYILNTTVKKEACLNNLAPTSSTTAQMVMGDALTVCLLECRGFTTSDFAKLHPGGALGKQFYLKVADLYINNQVPKVQLTDSIKTIILEISSKRLGVTAVLDHGQLKGIITDGDLRRMLEKTTDFEKITAKDIMNLSPKTVDPATLVVNALSIMRKNNITQLLVTDKDKYLGVLHLHDILKEGII
ncbi:MAG TPA: KpsF/GutQ family sugar-phosphate isomerase [Bacteroidales bacterium]|nr:KpsF/GutQ family sugar-phosphate isomerase [Bacteroidales bacterium]